MLTQSDLDAILDNKVRALFSKWVWRLKLQDWEISWKIVRAANLPPDRSGKCSSTVVKKIAAISILHPDDARSDWLDEYDIEYTVVHELTHLHLVPWSLYFEDGDQAVVLLEQAVHTIASALLAADRAALAWTNFPEFGGVQNLSSMVR